MNLTCEAIYAGGVLRPLTPITLPEGTRVRIRIEPLEERTGEDRRRAMEQFLEGAKKMGLRTEGRLPTRDELHERD